MIAHSKEQSSPRKPVSGKKNQKASDGIVRKSPIIHNTSKAPVAQPKQSVARKTHTKHKSFPASFLNRLDTYYKRNDLRYTKGLFKSLWQPILFGILVAVIAVSGLQLFSKYQYVRGVRNIAESQYNATLKRQESLTHTLDMLETRSGQERVLREHFHVVKEGEEIVVLIPDELGKNSE